MLKIAILNNSGNVGKTTICDNIFRKRIPNSEIIKVETINHDDTNDEKISAKDIGIVLDKIATCDNAIIDVGASNIEALMHGLKQMDGAHEDIDFFFVPTTPNHKQQKDTIKTISNLIDLDVEQERIKIIFNMNDSDYTLEQQYSVIFESHIASALKIKTPENQFIIDESPLFVLLGKNESTFQEALNDHNDYRTLIRSTSDREERTLLSQKRTMQKMAQKFDQRLNDTFKKITTACQFDIEEILHD
ncbi:StbB family protein [Vibrio parahaemolyticus]|uniref:StbB family protein n=1 Tax=Vibrio parahaemolyticus TaxID=670 RepID=UPI00186A38CF|nr:transcriptional regulator [Vibrio parahaemolyticus]HBN6205645.1 transcriptional regulator [Vibrio parahaemolyticus]